LQNGPISVWNSSAGTQPQIIPLNNSVINNQIILGIGPKPGEEGNATANVGAGISAEWAGPLSGFSPLTKIGTGELILSNAASTYTGNLIVNDGMLLAEHAKAFGTPTLSVNGGTAKLSPGLGTAMALRGVSVNLAAGKFDITNNAVVVDYTPPDVTPFDSIRAAIVSGYNGGGATAWTGNGITTSNGNASEFAIGYAEASDLTTIPAIFASVDGTAVLLRHTRYGDADLNGLINLDDFNRLAGNFGGVNKVWSQGDFDYNGNVDLDDFNLLAGNFGLSAGPDGVVGAGDWAALGSAVPEPSSAVLLLGTGLACLRRRRSRRAM
jgi:autotransporter-associated beta strand protein